MKKINQNNIVIKQVGGLFFVKTKENIKTCKALGKLKNNKILVGDYVELKDDVIIKVFPRTNSFIRPLISNVDQLVIVLSEIPEPDLSLIDKLIIYANFNNVKAVICVNKIDRNLAIYEKIKLEYDSVVEKVIKTSAIKNNIEELHEVLEGKFSVFCGQSAVGKSSLLNALLGENKVKTGDLSRIEKGKNTTRETEIFCLNDKTFIADTPGFSMLDLIKFSPQEVSKGYTEFYDLSHECRYKQCDHIFVEKDDCKVLREIEKDEILMNRYVRYKKNYLQVKERWDKRYD